MGTDTASGDALQTTWSQSKRLLYTYQSREGKMEIPVYLPVTLFGSILRRLVVIANMGGLTKWADGG
jgi:hypothetical protein